MQQMIYRTYEMIGRGWWRAWRLYKNQPKDYGLGVV